MICSLLLAAIAAVSNPLEGRLVGSWKMAPEGYALPLVSNGDLNMLAALPFRRRLRTAFRRRRREEGKGDFLVVGR